MRVGNVSLWVRKTGRKGFALGEVLIAVGIMGVAVMGMLACYQRFSQQAGWSAHSLTAQSMASEGAEQARAAKWDPQAWPQGVGLGQSDELGLTQYALTNTLAVATDGTPIFATNYIGITAVSTTPPLRQIRSDCVWSWGSQGVFSNTVVMFRGPDQ